MTYETVLDNERAYFDTSMWAAMLLRNASSDDLGFVQDRFKELKRGAFHVYVSDLVLMECSWAIRKRVAESKGNANASPDDVQEKIEGTVTSFYDEIVLAQRAGMITVENPEGSLDRFLQSSHDLSRHPQEQTLHYREQNKRYQYVGTGFLDFQHAILAAGLKCTCLYALDKGFNIFNSIPAFNALTIVTP